MKKRLELLAPAGSFESLKAAVSAGADAVYMGGSRFGARAYADNPREEALLEAIDYAHLYGVKLYLTVNTLLKERELERELYRYLLPCYERGLDAVIVQDLGVLQAVREWFPDLPMHASTQMTLCGAGGVRFLEREGARRVVLSRELSLAEIAWIRRNTNAELECFVHGALCYCYSGQCLFSSLLGGRSGNRGRCAQPCRLAYEVLDGQTRISPEGERTFLSLKDLCAIDLLPDLARLGVCSLKIEGRMKRPEYTAGVVRIYRKYLDHYLAHGSKGYRVAVEDREELRLLFNRDGFSDGYYTRHNGRSMTALSGGKPAAHEKKMYEKKAHESLIASLRASYVETERKIPVSGRLYASVGQPMRLELAPDCLARGDGTKLGLTVYGACPQTPENRPMEAEQLKRQLQKTGNTPFVWSELKIQTEGALFVPVQSLNQLRREAFFKLREEILRPFLRAARECGAGHDREEEAGDNAECDAALHVSVETEEQLRTVLSMADDLRSCAGLCAVYIEAECMEEARLSELIRRIHEKRLKAYVALPHIFRKETSGRYEERSDFWEMLPADGYVLRNLEAYEFLSERVQKNDWILDHNVYTFNRRCRRFWREKGVRLLTNPLELNSRELREISDRESIQIIYGRYPMMTTAGCLHKTLNRCGRGEEIWNVRDRRQKLFPVKNYCRDCYNIIYNSLPTALIDQTEELSGLSVGAYRVMFTMEGQEEAREVLAALVERGKPDGDFTRGHFRRGVE